MRVFTVETRITNWQNRFLPKAEHSAEVVCQALVDTGAVELALPAELIEPLRLMELGTMNAETADGGFHTYRIMGIAEVEVQGRTCQVQAVELRAELGLCWAWCRWRRWTGTSPRRR